MTADTGYIKVWFDGSDVDMAALQKLADSTDRQNLFSCGLSWLDELDCDGEAQSESISYDSIAATQEFLSHVLTQLPSIRFEGTLEHCWPAIPCKRTVVEFESADGQLLWCERTEEERESPEADELYEFESDDEEIFIPLTPYDE